MSTEWTEILDFEAQWFAHAGTKDEAIRRQLGISPTVYHQRLNAALDLQEALEHRPLLVKRLRRVRALRRARRAHLYGRQAAITEEEHVMTDGDFARFLADHAGKIFAQVSATACRTGIHRPDDDPEPGDRCKDCGQDLTWVGPGPYDWTTQAEQEEEFDG